MSKLNTYEKEVDGVVVTKIQNLHLTNVKLSYAWLLQESPKYMSPTEKDGYRADLLIYDKESVDLIKTYLNTAIAEAMATEKAWAHGIPNGAFMSAYRAPNVEENPFEEGALLVLKAKSPDQPDLLIRPEGSNQARYLTEQDFHDEAIVSGNIADVVIAIKAYSTNKGKDGIGKTNGIKIFLNAVCKTAEGTPISGRPKVDLVAEFSTGVDAFSVNPTTQAPQTKPVVVDPLAGLTQQAPVKQAAPITVDPLADLTQAVSQVTPKSAPTVDPLADFVKSPVQQAPQQTKPKTTIDDLLGIS